MLPGERIRSGGGRRALVQTQVVSNMSAEWIECDFRGLPIVGFNSESQIASVPAQRFKRSILTVDASQCRIRLNERMPLTVLLRMCLGNGEDSVHIMESGVVEDGDRPVQIVSFGQSLCQAFATFSFSDVVSSRWQLLSREEKCSTWSDDLAERAAVPND